MIKTYFILAIRNLFKRKLITFINVFGLALSLACGLVIYFFVAYTQGLDGFHENAKDIYLITHDPDNREGQTYGRVPAPLGVYLENESSGIKAVARLQQASAVVRSGSKVFQESVQFCDGDFFDLFSFPVLEGSNEAFLPGQVVISRDMATKYFGTDEAIGQMLLFRIENKEFTVEVTSVIDAKKDDSSFRLGLILPYGQLKSLGHETDQWTYFATATFVHSPSQDLVRDFTHVTQAFTALHNESSSDWKIRRFQLQPLLTLSENTYRIRSVISRGYGSPSGTYAFIAIGIVLLILSSLNYINTALASATGRLKEIAIRKVMGSQRRDLVLQFLVENFLIILFATVFAVFLARFLLLPGFASLFGMALEFDLSSPAFWVFTTTLILAMTLLSGGYPAYYLSRYQPLDALGQVSTRRGNNVLSQVLVFVQLFIAFVAIVSGILFRANEQYQKKKDLGYNSENLLVLIPPDQSTFQVLKERLSANPSIKAWAGTDHHIGLQASSIDFEYKTQSYKAKLYGVGPDYLTMMGTTVINGNAFERSVDHAQDVIINESLLALLDADFQIEEQIIIQESKYRVRGVIKNIFERSSQIAPPPMIFFYENREYHQYFVAKTKSMDQAQTLAEIEKTWLEVVPTEPFNGFYQDQLFAGYFQFIAGHGKVMSFVALLTVLISSFGLFGLLSLKISEKLKDFSIMKIIGADSFTLIREIMKMYMGLLIMALLLGTPGSYFAVKALFSIVYQDHVAISWLYPLLGMMIMLVVTFVTTSGFMRKLLQHNPISSMRNEN